MTVLTEIERTVCPIRLGRFRTRGLGRIVLIASIKASITIIYLWRPMARCSQVKIRDSLSTMGWPKEELLRTSTWALKVSLLDKCSPDFQTFNFKIPSTRKTEITAKTRAEDRIVPFRALLIIFSIRERLVCRSILIEIGFRLITFKSKMLVKGITHLRVGMDPAPEMVKCPTIKPEVSSSRTPSAQEWERSDNHPVLQESQGKASTHLWTLSPSTLTTASTDQWRLVTELVFRATPELPTVCKTMPTTVWMVTAWTPILLTEPPRATATVPPYTGLLIEHQINSSQPPKTVTKTAALPRTTVSAALDSLSKDRHAQIGQEVWETRDLWVLQGMKVQVTVLSRTKDKTPQEPECQHLLPVKSPRTQTFSSLKFKPCFSVKTLHPYLPRRSSWKTTSQQRRVRKSAE